MCRKETHRCTAIFTSRGVDVVSSDDDRNSVGLSKECLKTSFPRALYAIAAACVELVGPSQ